MLSFACRQQAAWAQHSPKHSSCDSICVPLCHNCQISLGDSSTHPKHQASYLIQSPGWSRIYGASSPLQLQQHHDVWSDITDDYAVEGP